MIYRARTALLPHMKADTLLADKAFDADQRVIRPLVAAGKTRVIPPKSNRKNLLAAIHLAAAIA